MTNEGNLTAKTKHTPRRRIILRYAWGLVAGWTCILFLLGWWDAAAARRVTRDSAITDARAHFNKDQAFRYWATAHGGIYVPRTEETPPNPHLSHVPERDIQTPSGKQLTLMNPAYMVRQINEFFAREFGIGGHITSLNPLRPGNAPDPWERKALKAFEQGRKEVMEFTDIGGEPYLRLIQPMITREGCLKCHAHQGYKTGDVRGGVSVSLPMTPYLQRRSREQTTMMLSHGLIWLLGLIAIFFGYLSIQKRIRRQEKTQQELDDAQLSYRMVADFTYDWEYWQNPDGSYRYVSPSCEHITGYPPQTYVQDPGFLETILLPEDLPQWTAYKKNVFDTRQSGEIVFRIRHKDGGIRWIDHASRPVTDGSGTFLGFRASNRDMTERKKLEQELNKKRDLESIGILAGGLAHDFNNLLAVIMGNISMVKEALPPTDPHRRLLENAEITSGNASDLVAKLLTFSDGGWLIRKETGMRAVLETARDRLPRNMPVFVGISTPPLLPTVDGDADQLVHAFANLILNAAEASPRDGKVRVRAESTPVTEQDNLPIPPGEYVKIEVADNGRGISEENLEKIFTPYFSTKEMNSQKGMGLGLSISYSIIRKHGGHITVNTREGDGTVFTVFLPQHHPKKHRPTEPEPAIEPGGPRIMVMDDDPSVRDLTHQMLQIMGYENAHFRDGDEALHAFETAAKSGAPFDIVILDIIVKTGAGGRETLRKLRRSAPHVKVIAMSSFVDNDQKEKLKQEGFTACLQKPFRGDDLKQIIQSLL